MSAMGPKQKKKTNTNTERDDRAPEKNLGARRRTAASVDYTNQGMPPCALIVVFPPRRFCILATQFQIATEFSI